ncbi:MIZ zinc finger family protein [Aphelenchoides avenae]|nr:MIZ zinc finger family protein [Aphelenchus avenae]
MNVDDERTMGPAEVKDFAQCLEELSGDTLKQLVQSANVYPLEELSELDIKVLKVSGFPSCTVDLPSPFGTQTFPSETVGQEANAIIDLDVWQTTKRAILDDESNILPYDTTKQRILDYYSSVDADEDIQTERLKVTLTCPLSKSRIKEPSRSRLCVHLQCFDLDNFLRSNAKREKPKCPICGVEADFDKLLVDEYVKGCITGH